MLKQLVSLFVLFVMVVGCSETGGALTPEELCGNGEINAGEHCDGTDLDGKTCVTQGFASGTLACTATCKFDTTGCQTPPVENCTNGIDDDGDGDIDCDDADCATAPACQPGECGNGTIETGEHCDGENLGGKTCQTQGFASGTLACTDACRFDTTGCRAAEDCDNGVDDDGDGDIDCADSDCADDPACEAGEDCGNGVIDAGESCDGGNHGSQTCATLGFTGGGTLVCNALCHFNTSGCEMASNDEICNNEIDDDGNGAIDCADDACFGHTACMGVVCGDGIADEGEVCDDTDLGGRTCVSLGYAGGTLACTASCLLSTAGCTGVPAVCGNAVCETGETELSCPADCGGGAVCGNGVLNPGENCDGSALGGNSCVSLGYTRGTLACNSACQFNTSACTRCGNGVCEVGEDYNSCSADCPQPNVCGNGTVNTGEQCDGSNLNGQTCASLGFVGGTLACNASCTFNTASCTMCGNGLLNGSEACDGSNLNGQTCVGLGYVGGTLACNASCTGFNVAGCYTTPSQVCGNGLVEGTEVCDGSNLNGQTCISRGYAGGTLACNSTCTGFITTGCVSSGGEDCWNGLDDNGDGLVDRFDPLCTLPGGVYLEQRCSDAINNDGDSYTDCTDYDCAGADVCRFGTASGNTYMVFVAGEGATNFGGVGMDHPNYWSNHRATGAGGMINAQKAGYYGATYSTSTCSPQNILAFSRTPAVDWSVFQVQCVSPNEGACDRMAIYVGCSVNPETGLQTQANFLVIMNRYDAAQQAWRNSQMPNGQWLQVAVDGAAINLLHWYQEGVAYPYY